MEQEVAIYSDDSFGSKIAEFKCFAVHVNERSRIISAPVENGQMSPDHKVIDPTIITVTGTIDCFDEATSNAIDKLNSMFENCRLQLYSLTSKEGAWSQLMLKDKPHKEDSDRPDLAVYELVFQEIMMVQGQGENAANSENSNNMNTGYCAAVRL